MRPIDVPGRGNARQERLLRVKFVALPLELAPPPATDRSALAGIGLRLRTLLSRVIGCLEAARP